MQPVDEMYHVAVNGIDSSQGVDYKEVNQINIRRRDGGQGWVDVDALSQPAENRDGEELTDQILTGEGDKVDGSPNLLVFGSEHPESAPLLSKLQEGAQLNKVDPASLHEAFQLLRSGTINGVVWTGPE
ncbi:MAG: hypothetical protein KC931_24295, partial [Candidatus Omnitrophica bacterium]|nr:hypothetical protein [Candidatus Omnitrophota bacterium]